ncbi:MAG: hypothetical protein E7531_02015 [Ruminococcaceae bacterium]|nr:hypothetical protein [Oscillospiraceae bacterium]
MNNMNDMLKKGVKKEDIDKMINSLNPDDAKKLNQMLNDKAATQRLLNSPEVKELMKKMFGDGKNG